MTTDHRAPRRRFLGPAMTPEQLEEFTAREGTCRVATINARGLHVTATGFVWDGTFVWVPSVVRAQRTKDIQRDPRMTVLVDAPVLPGDPGSAFVEFIGHAEIVGETPRVGEPNPELEAVERLLNEKYPGSMDRLRDGRDGPMGGHVWVRLTPDRIISSAGRF